MLESKENIENSEIIVVKRTRGRPRKIVNTIPDEDIAVEIQPEGKVKKVKKVVSSSEPKPKKKVKSLWVDALKIYNKDKKFIVPKKDSVEYNEVKKIMESFKTSSSSTI